MGKLKIKQLQILINKISTADHITFASTCRVLFNYLKKEASENKVYIQYEKEKAKWKSWPENREDNQLYYSWSLPEDIEDIKSLAYELYSTAGETNDNGNDLIFRLFLEERYDDNIYKFNNTFSEFLSEVLNDIMEEDNKGNINHEEIFQSEQKDYGNEVFIIHGHDELLKREVQLLLETAEVSNIVLHEQSDKGRTIIDKLIQESNKAGYAIALLSPDDRTHVGSKRARQNVILEIGYFMGRLGKERVRMIIKNEIEIPSDLNGILYEKHDENGAWKIKLLKEIQEAGIKVNLTKAISKF